MIVHSKLTTEVGPSLYTQCDLHSWAACLLKVDTRPPLRLSSMVVLPVRQEIGTVFTRSVGMVAGLLRMTLTVV